MNRAITDFLATIPSGPVPDPADLERLLAACWHEFHGDDGGMTSGKLLGRMVEVIWQPPVLSFTIERHDGTVQGSSRASLQQWRLDLDKKTAWCEERRFRQCRGRQPRLDVRALAEEVAGLILRHQEDERLRWCEGGRVRVLVGQILPKGSVAAQTLAGRRKRFRGGARAKRRIRRTGARTMKIETVKYVSVGEVLTEELRRLRVVANPACLVAGMDYPAS
jgi:hypothetical protein